MNITVKLDDGSNFSAAVQANAPVALNRFTGAGLVNADAATRSVRKR